MSEEEYSRNNSSLSLKQLEAKVEEIERQIVDTEKVVEEEEKELGREEVGATTTCHEAYATQIATMKPRNVLNITSCLQFSITLKMNIHMNIFSFPENE